MNQFLNYNFYKKNHLFHLVKPSYIPLVFSMILFMFLNTVVSMFLSSFSAISLKFTILLILLILFMNLWFYNIYHEYSDIFIINTEVEKNFIIGMLLFVCSEILLFASVFWAFFNSSLAPSIYIGVFWPPIGIASVNPFKIPLINTLLLLTSGATANNFYYLLKHISIRFALNYNIYSYKFNIQWYLLYGSLFSTVTLGLIFLVIQIYEYINSSFSISDSIYGSTFFMSTGLHGFHVLVGLLSLIFILFRLIQGDFDLAQFQTISTTCSLIYWHFVDAVWLFLFVFVYVWAS